MRTDKLKAHSLTHKDLTSLPEDEMKEELKARHAQQLERESQAEKLRLIKKIAVQEQLSIPPELVAVQIFPSQKYPNGQTLKCGQLRTTRTPPLTVQIFPSKKYLNGQTLKCGQLRTTRTPSIDCPNISIPKISERTKNVLIA